MKVAEAYPIDWAFSVTFSNGHESGEPPESVIMAIELWLKEYELEICCVCGASVSPNTLNYKHRVWEGTNILTRKKYDKQFPQGAWFCGKCNVINYLKKQAAFKS